MKYINAIRSITAIASISVLTLLSCGKSDQGPAPEETEQPDQEEPKPIQEMDITAMGTLSVSSENRDGKTSREGSLKLVDNDLSTKFLTYSYSSSFYMQMEFPEAKLIASYSLTSGDDADDRDPENWTISGSADGTEWIDLSTMYYEFFPERKQLKRYYFKNPKAYKYYRLKVRGNRGSDLFQLTEWRLFQMPASQHRDSPVNTVEFVTSGANTLTFVNKTQNLNPAVKAGLINVFKVNYQKMADAYNPDATKKVVFVIEPGYEGVAAAFGGAVIRYDPDWFQSNPKDIDVATHELMHVVQAYPGVEDSGWVTEGIADYVRFKFGVDNAGAQWSLPDFSPDQSYRDAYRVTARFLHWLETHGQAGIVVKLDKSMRSAAYTTATFWPANTGKTVDQLWADYAANPAL
ncbi:MAG TPA: basic secretory protein-like protein [Pedobacter sp.]|nr:basic secretory protein-like protein [Pedobacter sp.]